MIRGFYTAGSGLIAQQTAIDNAANNMANINTTGFKKQRVSFSELLYSNLGTPDGAQPQNLKVGNGSRVSQITSIHTQVGTFRTDNPLDFALSKGYFGVLTQDGNVKFTGDGSFHISVEDTGNYLVTADGNYVLGRDGNKVLADSDDLLGEIGIFQFSNPLGLANAGNNLYEQTKISGAPAVIQADIISGCLESSNVDLTGEMADLIAIQKSYQFNAKLIQTADEIANITNNLR